MKKKRENSGNREKSAKKTEFFTEMQWANRKLEKENTKRGLDREGSSLNT